jgi:hypothetical protein
VSRSANRLLGFICAALACFGTLALGAAVIGGAAQDTTSASVVTLNELVAETCSVSGPLKGLTAEQAADADVIVSVAMTATDRDRRAARIALMTAITESRLYDVDDVEQNSLGLFQERPLVGFGTADQLMYPVYATFVFVAHLLAVPGWRTLAPWLAAEAVQRSAGRDGSEYEANWVAAGSVLAGVLANRNAPRTCARGAGRPRGRALLGVTGRASRRTPRRQSR